MKGPVSRLRSRLMATIAAATAWVLSTGILMAAVAGQEAPGESNLPFLYGVYTVTWATFFAYAFYVSRRQRELRSQIEELRRVLEERDK